MLKKISILVPYKIQNNELYVWTQIRESSDALNGYLEFPGGKSEFGENEMLTVIREVREETGALIESPELFGSYSFDGDIMISVFALEMVNAQLQQNGLVMASKLLEEGVFIMPNNRLIITDFIASFKSIGRT